MEGCVAGVLDDGEEGGEGGDGGEGVEGGDGGEGVEGADGGEGGKIADVYGGDPLGREETCVSHLNSHSETME